MHFLLKL